MHSDNDNILKKVSAAGLARPSAGMKVPDGYFRSFAERMVKELPERPEAENKPMPMLDRSFWQKVRPYVYMAAMFAGIWLMMQLFTILSGKATLEPVDSNPVLASALATDDFVFDYVYSDMPAWELVDDMIDNGDIDADYNFESFGDLSDNPEDSQYILP